MRVIETEVLLREIERIGHALSGLQGVPRPDLVLQEALDPSNEFCGLVTVTYVTWFRFSLSVKNLIESERVPDEVKNVVHNAYRRLLDSLA